MKTIQQIAAEVGELVVKKNAAYGDAIKTSEEVLKIYFPDGIPVEK